MKLFTIFSSLYLLKTFIRNKEIEQGIDERLVIFPDELTNEKVTREQIIKIQEKREMLDFLESNHTKTEDKLHEIGGRGMPSILSLLSGGLLSDWNFEFDFEFDPNALNFDGL